MGERLKKIFKICFIIFLVGIVILGSNEVFAEINKDNVHNDSTYEENMDTDEDGVIEEGSQSYVNLKWLIQTILEVGVGPLTTGLALFTNFIGLGIFIFLYMIFSPLMGENNIFFPFPDVVIFNKLGFFDPNFISPPSYIANGQRVYLESAPVRLLGDTISSLYYSGFIIAGSIFVISAMLIGIRLALTSIAEEKAHYKQALTSWIGGIALLFLAHFLMYSVFTINEKIVEEVSKPVKDLEFGLPLSSVIPTKIGKRVANFIVNIPFLGEKIQELTTFKFNGFTGLIGVFTVRAISGDLLSSIFMIVLLGQSCAIILMYLRRLFYCILLGVLAPLVIAADSLKTITGATGSKLFNNWFKNFALTVFLQSFQAVFLLIILLMISKITTSGSPNNLTALLAVIALRSLISLEKVIKQIFGIQDGMVGDLKSSGLKTIAAIKTGQQMGHNIYEPFKRKREASRKIAQTGVSLGIDNLGEYATEGDITPSGGSTVSGRMNNGGDSTEGSGATSGATSGTTSGATSTSISDSTGSDNYGPTMASYNYNDGEPRYDSDLLSNDPQGKDSVEQTVTKYKSGNNNSNGNSTIKDILRQIESNTANLSGSTGNGTGTNRAGTNGTGTNGTGTNTTTASRIAAGAVNAVNLDEATLSKEEKEEKKNRKAKLDEYNAAVSEYKAAVRDTKLSSAIAIAGTSLGLGLNDEISEAVTTGGVLSNVADKWVQGKINDDQKKRELLATGKTNYLSSDYIKQIKDNSKDESRITSELRDITNIMTGFKFSNNETRARNAESRNTESRNTESRNTYSGSTRIDRSRTDDTSSPTSSGNNSRGGTTYIDNSTHRTEVQNIENHGNTGRSRATRENDNNSRNSRTEPQRIVVKPIKETSRNTKQDSQPIIKLTNIESNNRSRSEQAPREMPRQEKTRDPKINITLNPIESGSKKGDTIIENYTYNNAVNVKESPIREVKSSTRGNYHGSAEKRVSSRSSSGSAASRVERKRNEADRRGPIRSKYDSNNNSGHNNNVDGL